MGEAEVEPSIVPAADASPPAPAEARPMPSWARGMACLAIFPLLGYIGQTGGTLWGEWSRLRQDRVRERGSAIVGYVDINPEISYAAPPPDWSHDDGDASLLWAGWRGGKNHWFRFGRGDIDSRTLTLPIGRDAIRAIDVPIYEREGGACWGRVAPEAPVVAIEEGGAAVAYPMRLLDKVEVVNDRVGDRPVLVVLSPQSGAVAAYEATLDGRRVTLGHGGYFRDDHPILYDRGSQSLWIAAADGMAAIAGPRKGARLKRIARLDAVAWGDWRSAHPDGRLVVGADRSKGLPAD